MQDQTPLYVVAKILSDLGHLKALKKLQKDINDKKLNVENIPEGVKNFNFEALVAGLTAATNSEVPKPEPKKQEKPKRLPAPIEFVRATEKKNPKTSEEVENTEETKSAEDKGDSDKKGSEKDDVPVKPVKASKTSKTNKTTKKTKPQETDTAIQPKESTELETAKPAAKRARKKKDAEEPAVATIPEVPSGRFKRIQDDVWMERIEKEELKENSYTMKNDEFSLKAAQELKQVKGKNFRTEKMKKKRASWKGSGEISTQVNSIKFDDSDSD